MHDRSLLDQLISSDPTTSESLCGSERAVEIVVVVPVFRHSVFLVDAVESACCQEIAQVYRIVIVDDGCPFEETRRVAKNLALAHEGRVIYVRRPNGGLSAARNTGVNYALARWPSTQAFYFLDADNRIEPKSLAKAYAILRSDPNIGWVYPDIAMFGSSEEIWDYSGRYSVLRHLNENVSEAGSMVRREIFDSGCFYDESMRQGYEDWEFWWQCIDAGFVGRHVPFFGLRYRKRPESMLSQAEREHAAVLTYMRRKHRQLFRTKRLLALESQDAPRYALIESLGHVRVCTDPKCNFESIACVELVARYLAAWQQPHLHLVPQFIIAASPVATELLSRLRLDRLALWWMEKRAITDNGPHFIAIELALGCPRNGIALAEMDSGYWPVEADAIHLLMATSKILRECAIDANDEWARSVLTAAPQPRTAVLRIEVGEGLSLGFVLPNAAKQFLEFFDLLHQSRQQIGAPMPMVKPRSLTSNSVLGRTPSTLLECGNLLPLADISKRDVCFVLPLVAFGGVEQVALKVAAEFRRSGWRCHLLVLAKEATLDARWLAVFDSVLFYNEPSMRQWCEEQKYLGTHYPEWATFGDTRWLEGLLLPMDAVINFHAADIYRAAGKLRSKGVALAASLHVNDRTHFGREAGHNFLALGHEHVLDLIAPCSYSLLEWCHSQGVPLDKLVAVPNAPAQDMTPDDVAAALKRRHARRACGGPINLLFFGRLDRQKGLDRLTAVIERCRQMDLPVRWRLVGGTVVIEGSDLVPESLRDLCEPPVQDTEAIAGIYEWADVLFLPSHWEGLPLTILEAARLGVVPLVARVGAVDEAVIHDETGLLIEDLPLAAFADAASTQLIRLTGESELLERLSASAAKAMTRNWETACQEFIARLDSIVERNRGTVKKEG